MVRASGGKSKVNRILKITKTLDSIIFQLTQCMKYKSVNYLLGFLSLTVITSITSNSLEANHACAVVALTKPEMIITFLWAGRARTHAAQPQLCVCDC